MKAKSILLLLLFAGLCSCEQQDPEQHIQFLEGYWSIDKVLFKDGNEKNFSLSTTIDYIEIQGRNGIRKKVQPKLDGTFLTTEASETFSMKVEDDSLRLYYTTPFNSWIETVLKAKDSSLVVLNRDGKTYYYKKFAPFRFD